jgi:plastocyanin
MTPFAYRILPACLLALATAVPAAAADQWSSAQRLVVALLDNRFEPDHLTFHAGGIYELRLENRGKDLHEFTAPGFLKSATIRDKRLLSNGGTDIVVQAGKSVSIFLSPRIKGHYDLTCADHDWDGMTGSISVD